MAGPSTRDASYRQYSIFPQVFQRHNWSGGDLELNVDKVNHMQEPDTKKYRNVRLVPSFHRSLVESEVDEEQACYTKVPAKVVN